MNKKQAKGRPFSRAVTDKKMMQFIDEILIYKNCATFQRRIGINIVRACFKVHRPVNSFVPVYTLTYADDNNAANIIIDTRVFRSDNLHYVIQDFKRSIDDYLCVLAK